jgi:hypothetical protein
MIELPIYFSIFSYVLLATIPIHSRRLLSVLIVSSIVICIVVFYFVLALYGVTDPVLEFFWVDIPFLASTALIGLVILLSVNQLRLERTSLAVLYVIVFAAMTGRPLGGLDPLILHSEAEPNLILYMMMLVFPFWCCVMAPLPVFLRRHYLPSRVLLLSVVMFFRRMAKQYSWLQSYTYRYFCLVSGYSKDPLRTYSLDTVLATS